MHNQISLFNRQETLISQKMYNKNIKVLEKYYPQLAKQVKQIKLRKFKIVKSGPKNIVNLLIPSRQTFYYNYENPFDDARNQLKQLNIKNTQLAIFLGIGLGYELQFYLMELAAQQLTERILVIEKDLEIFKAALHVSDLTKIIKNKAQFNFLIGIPPEKLFEALYHFIRENSNYKYLKALNPVYHPSALELYNDYYKIAMANFREAAIYMLENYGNDPRDTLIGLENIIANLNEIIDNPGINLLFNKFKNKPAIVVSTGPSLNKNKHLLKGLEDKALIICPDASLRILLDMGVKPHLVTSLERIPETVKLLEGFSQEEVKDVYLTALPVVRREAYEVYPGPRIIVYRNIPHFKWIGIERGTIDVKQSSGNMAFEVAAALGCNPIILIGQDLAYSDDGKTHASGTYYGENQTTRGKIFEVMGIDGKPVKTNYIWNLFRLSYEADIANYQGLCIDSTEGGAFIKGTKIMPFKEAIDKYIDKPFYPLQIIKRSLESFNKEDKELQTNHIRQKIKYTLNGLNNCIKICQSGLNELKNYSDKLNDVVNGNDSLANEELKALVLKIEDCKKRLLNDDIVKEFLLFIVQAFHLKFDIEVRSLPSTVDDESKLNAKILLMHISWFDTFEKVMTICISFLKKALDEISEQKESLFER